MGFSVDEMDMYLYKAKRSDTKDWVEGYLVKYKKIYWIYTGKINRAEKFSNDYGKTIYQSVKHMVIPSTICRCSGQRDISGKLMYEGDIFEVYQGTQILALTMILKYGIYESYCPADDTYMDNVGFYVEADGFPQMPMGPAEEYAKVIGNIFDNF